MLIEHLLCTKGACITSAHEGPHVAGDVWRAKQRSPHPGHTASPSMLAGPPTPQSFPRSSPSSAPVVPEGTPVLGHGTSSCVQVQGTGTQGSCWTLWAVSRSTDEETGWQLDRVYIQTGTRGLSAKHLPSTPCPGPTSQLGFTSSPGPLAAIRPRSPKPSANQASRYTGQGGATPRL